MRCVPPGTSSSRVGGRLMRSGADASARSTRRPRTPSSPRRSPRRWRRARAPAPGFSGGRGRAPAASGGVRVPSRVMSEDRVDLPGQRDRVARREDRGRVDRGRSRHGSRSVCSASVRPLLSTNAAGSTRVRPGRDDLEPALADLGGVAIDATRARSGVTPTGCSTSTSSASRAAKSVMPGPSGRWKRRLSIGRRRSRSTSTTCRPVRASAIARFAIVVDLPSRGPALVTITVFAPRLWFEKSKLARSRATASVDLVGRAFENRRGVARVRGVGSLARSGICSSCSTSSACRIRRSSAFRSEGAADAEQEAEQHAEDRIRLWRRSDLVRAVGWPDDRGRVRAGARASGGSAPGRGARGTCRCPVAPASRSSARRPWISRRARVRLAVSVSSLYAVNASAYDVARRAATSGSPWLTPKVRMSVSGIGSDVRVAATSTASMPATPRSRRGLRDRRARARAAPVFARSGRGP